MTDQLDRRRYREALAHFIAESGATLHVTASVPSDSQRVLEAHLRNWLARVDERALGRNWAGPKMRGRRTTGYVFFERGRFGGHLHAHLLLAPPHGYSRLKFVLEARYLFQSHPVPIFRQFHRKSVAPNGTMHVQLIGQDPGDRSRVARYDTKELAFRPEAELSWKFVEDLTAS